MFISKYSVTGAIFFLFVSGCGGGGKDSSAPTGSSLSPSYSIIGNISGMNDIRSIELALGSEILLISQNGSFSFTQRLKKGTEYEIEIERKPARQDCQINNASGVIGDMNVSDIEVVCLDDESFPLFALDRLHKIRLTMSLEEWRAVLQQEINEN